MQAVENFLHELREIHATGASVPETSFYPVLSSLFNELGKTLKPRVRCVIHLANRGAGLPDGGFFTASQFQRASDAEPKPGQLPERGAMEVKSPAEDVAAIARTRQVRDYCDRYGLVLVTNLREFRLYAPGQREEPKALEGYVLARDEASFWALVAHPQKCAKEHGQRLAEYLLRVMRTNAPLTQPADLAWFLASYARDAKARIEEVDLPALDAIRTGLEEALGMRFTGEKGDHFFRSTLVQTLFYGVFSAWVLWHRENPNRTGLFNWHEAEWSLRVPFIRSLYEQIATPSKLGPLGLVEVLDWTAAALNRVDRAAFFQKFQDEHAVQYFYEPFLEAFDPDLRKELGVWYTPPEIVQYQVARVNTVLREELGVEDGLADPNVVVLDPCCGTGAYLVETLRCIAETLHAKGGDALIASDLKTAAMTRVFGFELLPAPFVVAHLQLGLMLHKTGAPLSIKNNERVGVFLTNALTGWEPPKEPKQTILGFLHELQEERDAAQRVKREAKILVVMGNPPYNAFAGVSPEEEQGLVEPYKVGLNKPVSEGGWGIKKFNLDDLYVRFFRLAERRIAEMTGKGVVSFISNFSYLEDPSFVVMRKRLLAEFDRLWFDCMNGDSRETGKLTPDGRPDPSVFSTEYNRAGIRVGTAVCIMVRKERRSGRRVVRYRDFWGVAKRQELLQSASKRNLNKTYLRSSPCLENRFSFRPESVESAYRSWPEVPEFCLRGPFNGPVERRANSLITYDASSLDVLLDYLNEEKDDQEIRRIAPAFMHSSGEFDARKTRARLKGNVKFDRANVVRYPFKPFDVRYAYLDPAIQPLFSRPSPELLAHARVPGNGFLITRDTADKTPEGSPFLYTRVVCDYDCISGHATHFPIMISDGRGPVESNGQHALFMAEPRANLSERACAYLERLRSPKGKVEDRRAFTLWMHVLAIGYSPGYLADNADGIRQNWPRIPLPKTRKLLEASAELGRRVAALLDTESEVKGVTSGKIEGLCRTIGVLSKVGGGNLNVDAGDLAVTASWGHAGNGGVTMPAKGRVVARAYTPQEREAIAAGAKDRGLSPEKALDLLGRDTRDVYLNDRAYWRNVPAHVWEYYICGYQVIKKWLSYRESELLGRALKPEEAREVTNIARRIACILLLQPALDENYESVKSETYDWSQAPRVEEF